MLEPGTMYDVMTPIAVENTGEPDKDVWAKVGTAFADHKGDHVLRVSLLTLPVGAVAPMKLFIFPKKEWNRG